MAINQKVLLVAVSFNFKEKTEEPNFYLRKKFYTTQIISRVSPTSDLQLSPPRVLPIVGNFVKCIQTNPVYGIQCKLLKFADESSDTKVFVIVAFVMVIFDLVILVMFVLSCPSF